MAAQTVSEQVNATSTMGHNPIQVQSQTKHGSFFTDVLKLVSGSASAQVLAIVAAPFIARLFAPEAFGTAAVFVSIAGLISAIVGMRYELSIVLPAEDEDAVNSMAVSLCFALLTSAATGLGLVFCGNWLLRVLNAPGLHGYLWLVPVNIFLNGVFAALSYWNTRKKQFGRQTVSQFSGAVAFISVQIAAGVAGYRSGATIVVATVLSVLLTCLMLGAQTLWSYKALLVRAVKPAGMLNMLKRYSSFPKYSTASAVLNNLGWQVPTFMLSGYFSPSVVGHFALGNRVLRIPINLVGANIATVFFQHASQARQEGKLPESVGRLFVYLIKLFLFPSLVLLFAGKAIFVIAFGDQWAEAGIYTQILSMYVLCWFMAVPLGIALNVMEKQALELRLVILILGARVAALVAGGSLGSARITLLMFSVTGILAYIYFYRVVLRSCSVPLEDIKHTLTNSVAAFAPAGLILGFLYYRDVWPPIILSVAFLVLFLYYAWLILSDPSAKEILIGLWHRTNATPLPSTK